MEVRFSAEAKEIVDFLNDSKHDRMIYSALIRKIALIKNNPHFGDPIKKNLIPDYYRKKYGANNLFRVELPQYWRMLYTLTNYRVEIIALVIDVCDHREYDKKFKYRKK